MSSLDFLEITPAACSTAQRRTEAYLKGEQPVETVLDTYASKSAFLTALTTNAEARDKTATENNPGSNYRNRVMAIQAFAAERDLRYAMAGRPRMMAIGFNQKLRTKFNSAMTATLDL